MEKFYPIFIWKKAPFLRLLIPVIVGIVLEHFGNIQVPVIISGGIITCVFLIVFSFMPEVTRYRFRWLQGIFIFGFLIVFGLFITWQKDIRNHKNWYGQNYNDSSFLVVTINEPPVKKAKSFKAIATVESTINKTVQRKTEGKILIYFAKDSFSNQLKYGDQVIIGKKLQSIRNSGNPGGFNYAQYMAFQQIFHQCYLKKQDWILLKDNSAATFKKILFSTRDYVIKTIGKYIEGGNEAALAKALLIGYKVDLDKDLVQAFSNAGVVHLIAISGLHLALIYGLLFWITLQIPFLKNSKTLRILVILLCLWFFALLTGASPSVMRAAVMFSFISVGSIFKKRASVYNSLCASAFALLCFDPFLLWNVGFQLSYLAVLGIVVLQRPIYHWVYTKNKIPDLIWKMASVSIAAQIFTIPLCFYYFHQLPLFFLVANLIAIPLATLALWSCIGLLIVSPLGVLPVYFGKLITGILWLMNHSVLLISTLPFALWNNVSISVFETILLYIIFISFIYWAINKNKQAFKIGLAFTLVFSVVISVNKWNYYGQKKMIVYNIPFHTAIDFIDGNKNHLVSDSALSEDKVLQNFNLKPARISFMANNESDMESLVFLQNNFYQFYNKKILIIDTSISYSPILQKVVVDYLIISKNSKVKIKDLAQLFECKQYIFDASNSLWKIGQWKKECEELHLQSHSVSEQGAFVINL
ncbi:MAG TPA: ComEC/Rec2 family competence protein [Hanamia sp.]|nr:ComEC/Rec2 family competence protein [Hanamia sp.]